MTSRKRIAFLVHSHYPRDIRVRRQAEALVAEGWEATVVCLRQQGEPKQETVRGVEVRRLPVDRHRGAPLAVYLLEYSTFCLLAAFVLLWRHFKRLFAVVQVANPPDFLLLAALGPKLFGAKVIFDIHDNSLELAQSRFGFRPGDWFYQIMAWWERFAVRQADLVLSPEAGQQEKLLGRGLPPEKARIVINSPDEAIFDPARFPRRRAVKITGGDACAPKTFTVISHGTVVRRYGVDVLIRAAAEAKQVLPNLRVEVYGEGDFLLDARCLAEDLGLKDIVVFHGFRPLEEVAGALSQADVCVIPNRRDIFTDLILPTKLLEATALGVPCLVTRTDTVERYFTADAAGFLEPEDVSGLASWLVRLAEDPALGERMAAKARECAAPLAWDLEKRKYADMVVRASCS